MIKIVVIIIIIIIIINYNFAYTALKPFAIISTEGILSLLLEYFEFGQRLPS
jgi:hypothetical protein